MSDAAYHRNMHILAVIVAVLLFLLACLIWNALLPKYYVWRDKRACARKEREQLRFAIACWPQRHRQRPITCGRCHERMTVPQALAHRCVGTFEDLQ